MAKAAPKAKDTVATTGHLVDIDRLERLLIEAARAQRTVTYAELLAHFGKRVAPRLVYALCRDLGEICRRNRARGEPELAVLVVRQSDGLPGEGFFRSAWRDGDYDGPPTGPAARGFIREQQDEVYRFFADGGRPAEGEPSPSLRRARAEKGSGRSPRPGRRYR